MKSNPEPLIDVTRLDINCDDAARLQQLGIRLIQLQEQGRQADLERDGDRHDKVKSWYDGPPVPGLKNEIGALLATHGLRGFQIEDYDIYEMEGSSTVVDRRLLVEYGVDPDIVEKCTVRTPYRTIVVKYRSAGRGRRKAG